MTAKMKCPGCGEEVEAVAVADVDVAAAVFFGAEPGAWVKEARELRAGEMAILHHSCSHPQIGEPAPERERAWWACAEPGRAPDEDMRYELNCRACAERWYRERTG